MTKVPDRCVHGHALTQSNTYLRPDGSYRCKRCAAAAQRRHGHRTDADRVADLRARADEIEARS